MPRILTAIALSFTLSFALAGCEPLPYQPDAALFYTPPPAVAPETVTETATVVPGDDTPDFDETVSGALDAGTAEETTGAAPAASPPPLATALPPPEAPMLAQQRAACAREGGRLTPRGTGLFMCVHQTRDAGRQCDSAANCEGACLARSRTCAPMRPLLGCQEVFTLPGRRETLCTD